MSDQFDIIQSIGVDIFIIITYIVYAAIYLGLALTTPDYIKYLNFLVKLYVGLFLFFRFNPWTTHKCSDLDKKIAYNGGIFLILDSYIKMIYFTI